MNAVEAKAKFEYQRTLVGLSTREVAIKAHMSHSRLYNRLKDPDSWTLGELKRVAAVLHIAPDTLVDWKGEK